ncbi:MAG: ribonuclease HI family protein [Actinomycetota bacterium]
MSSEDAAVLYVDGASFGNPGPSGIGFVLTQGDKIVAEGSEDIGWGTNNQAEYRALLAGLREAIERGFDSLLVRGDSQLLVRQVTGEYKVKDRKLKSLMIEIQELIRRFERVSFEHVRRELNERADELAKAGAESAKSRGVRPQQTEIFE